MIETDFNFVRGTSYSKTINITGYSGSIDEMYFTVKEGESDRIPVMQKTIGNGITALESEDENIKSYRLLISPDDTEDLDINKSYFFDIKVVTSQGVTEITKKVVAKGRMILSANITRSFNES